MLINRYKLILLTVTTLFVTLLPTNGSGQAPTPPSLNVSRYLDTTSGMTADAAVALALENNGELQAVRKEVDAARALVKQAGLRSNPKLTVAGAKQIHGADNNEMADAMLPLELGGRRAARIAVAQRELEIRQLALENFVDERGRVEPSQILL